MILEENTKEVYTVKDYLHSIFWVALVAALVVPVSAAIANPPSRSLTAWLLIAYIVLDITLTVLYLVLTIPTDKRIISKLNNMGYQCQMEEGQIVFKRQDLNWNLFTWNIKKRYRRVSFSLSFTDNNLDKDHALTNRIFCIIGSRNRHVTLTWNGTNSYACEFHTVFTSTRDIEREFKTAMRVIDDTMNELYTLFQRAFAQQPTETEHKIGFHVGEDNSATEDNISQVRAQSNENTTN